MSAGLILNKIATWIYLLPLGVGLLRSRDLSGTQWILWGIVLLGGIAEIVGYFAGIRYGTNLPVFHFFILLEFGFYLLLFHKANALEVRGKWLLLLFALFSLGFVLVVLYVQALSRFPSYTRFSSSLLLIIGALTALLIQVRKLEVTRLDKLALFWICCGILVFFTGNSLLFLFMNRVAISAEVYDAIWPLFWIFNILFYLIYTIALLCKDPIPNSYRFSSPREF